MSHRDRDSHIWFFLHILLCFRLEGKIVIITGGASGIGAEAARLFTEHGARVVIADVQDEIGQNVAVSIGEDKVSYYHCDVRDETEVENAVKFTVEKHGRIDVLFSNAGVLEKQQGSILDLDLHDFDRVMAVNLRGAAAFIKHVARSIYGGEWDTWLNRVHHKRRGEDRRDDAARLHSVEARALGSDQIGRRWIG